MSVKAKKAKAYLNQYHKLRRAVESLERRIEEMRAKAEGVGAIRYDKDRVQTSPKNTMEENSIKLADMEDQYAALLLEYYEKALLIEKQVTSMEPELFSTILRMRYIETDPGGYQMSLRRIWWLLGTNRYSYDYITNMHGVALRKFSEKFLQC